MNKTETIQEQLLKYQPWEIIGPIFFLFARALKGAPKEKIDEFFKQFENGVRDHIRCARLTDAIQEYQKKNWCTRDIDKFFGWLKNLE